MKMIKPIVNILKIIDNYDDFIIGFSGVISDGSSVKSEAVTALINLKKADKHVVLLSNSPQRVASIAKILHENRVPLSLFDAIITAGEILHYHLKSKAGVYAALGSRYYQMGSQKIRPTPILPSWNMRPVWGFRLFAPAMILQPTNPARFVWRPEPWLNNMRFWAAKSSPSANRMSKS